MAKASPQLIASIRNAAKKIAASAKYQWGHMGSCNCGFLAQEITSLTKGQIHAYAMEKHGDWTDQVSDFCPTSGLPFDLLISELLKAGLSLEDLKNLEKLKDPDVLRNMPEAFRYPSHNNKKHVVSYMLTWADLLEKRLPVEENIKVNA